MLEEFYNDDIKAIDARFEAQKIAFAPIIFQVSKCMIDFNILKIIEEAGDAGITEEDILKNVNLSSYALSTLLELSLGLSLIKIVKDSNPYKYILGKTGFFLINDNLTRVNINFVNDICYKGMFYLNDSLKNSKPEGLKVFGDYETIYKGLSSIPESDRKSWIDFDNYYSDGCYESSLPIIFKKSRKNIMDIGANTAKFSISALKYNNDVRCSLVDLEGQIKLAKKNIDDNNFSSRVEYFPMNILEEENKLPKNCDVIWMSQFLDCFSIEQIKLIMRKVKEVSDKDTDIFVLEPLWDKQKYISSAFSIQATSLYFTAIANGNSKMYPYKLLVDTIEEEGFKLVNEYHRIGKTYHSLLNFKLKI